MKKKNIKKEDKKTNPELEQLKKENEELKSTLLRLQADFDNFRKRNEIERANTIKCANEDIISEILPAMDNFSRALTHKPKELVDNEYIKGLEYIKIQLEKILTDNGLKKIECKRGDEFDHNLEEAIETVEDKELKSGQITEVVLDGYKLGDKLIRPASVKVVK